MVSREQFDQANERGARRRETGAIAIRANYNRRTRRIVVALENGLEVAFPPELVEGLKNATPSDLNSIEISPSGLGLHFPSLDADVYLPALTDPAPRRLSGPAPWLR